MMAIGASAWALALALALNTSSALAFCGSHHLRAPLTPAATRLRRRPVVRAGSLCRKLSSENMTRLGHRGVLGLKSGGVLWCAAGAS
jgi:hypothetical protein